MVRHAAGLGGDEPAADARGLLAKLVEEATDADRIVDGVAAAIGLGGEATPTEIFVAGRRFLEWLARESR